MKCPGCNHPRIKRVGMYLPRRDGSIIPFRRVLYYRCPGCKKRIREYCRVLGDSLDAKRTHRIANNWP